MKENDNNGSNAPDHLGNSAAFGHPPENPDAHQDFPAPPPRPPTPPSMKWALVTPDEVRSLTRFLTGRRSVTAQQMIDAGLAAGWGLRSPNAFRRKLRAIAAASDGAILSHQGSQGYCLTAEATEKEVRRAIDTLRHSAGEHLERARRIEEAWRQSR